MRKPFEWSYGITTVQSRLDNLLPQTLENLKAAGFPKPVLFIDNYEGEMPFPNDLEATSHHPKISIVANFMTALWILFTKKPNADRFAIFQDDFVTYKNLREYLEKTEYPECSYLNLYTFPRNQRKCPEGHEGWYPSDQRGKGAVALVFDKEAVEALLTARHMLRKVAGVGNRSWKTVDGGIVESLIQAGFQEYVHNPSLVQHIGDVSTLQNRKHLKAESFRGEDFDALELLK
jgi:hypothetical protein